MVAAAEGLGLDAQVHLEVREEVDVFTGLKGDKCLQAAHGGGDEDQLSASVRIELALDDLGAHLSHEELVYGLHLECSSVKVAVLPFKLGGCGVIFCVVLAPCRHPVDVDVFKLVDAGHCVLIEHAETCGHPFEHIVCEDVQLCILCLVLKHVDALTDICSEDSPALFNLDAGDLRHKVLVLLLAKQLLQTQIVHTQDVSHSSYKFACAFIEGIRDVFTVGTVQEL